MPWEKLMSEWTSIRDVTRPSSLEEAARAIETPGVALLAGGSYLLAERPRGIHTLVDLGPLLDTRAVVGKHDLQLGAGITLQEMVDVLPDEASVLAEAATLSPASRNVRNRRTLGGEIARRRADSDLVVALAALNPLLEVIAGRPYTVPFAEWEGNGIVARVRIDRERTTWLRHERVSLLPTSPAFVLVAAVLGHEDGRVAVGGRVEEIRTFDVASLDVATRQRIAHEGALAYSDDHTGSRNYKETLIDGIIERWGNA